MAFLKPGPNNNGLRGRMGGQVYSGGGEDTIVREYVKPVEPNTPAQQAQQGRFRRGSQGWGQLTDAQRANWTDTVAKFGIKAKATRRQGVKAMTPMNYYSSLTSKFLAATPGGTPPVWAPGVKFPGDVIALALSVTTGNLVVTASAANRGGVKTEILIQRLAASYRKPDPDGYRSKAYVAFAAGSLSTSIPVTPGAYSVAAQFVNVATGETSGYQVLGTQLVSLSLEAGGSAEFEEAQAALGRKSLP